jgi:hypothetical protein
MEISAFLVEQHPNIIMADGCPKDAASRARRGISVAVNGARLQLLRGDFWCRSTHAVLDDQHIRCRQKTSSLSYSRPSCSCGSCIISSRLLGQLHIPTQLAVCSLCPQRALALGAQRHHEGVAAEC